jgi:TRAP-type uncharacterized transport system substrate-binding protein
MAKFRPNHKDNPYVENTFLLTVLDELRAMLLFIRHQWYYLILILIGIGLVIYYLQPLPPDHIRISKGQSNSSLEVDALNFKKVLEEHGIEAELIESKGTLDSLRLLEEKKVDVALTQSGVPIKKHEHIVSLGTLNYQAFWFFYTGPEVVGDDIFSRFENKRIYVNKVGSGTRFMTDTLFNISDKLRALPIQRVEDLSPKQAVKALKTNQIDGMFLLAGYDSLNIQELLGDPKVHILNFPIAEALAYKIKGVDVVKLPKGIYALSPPRPSQDIKMIAASTTLLARSNLHPEIQYLLLEASKDLYDHTETVFDRPGGFPAFTEKGVKRSKIAEKFYDKGPPLLSNEMPYWLASFLDNAWFSLIAIAAILYPLMQFRPNYRKNIYDLYSERIYNELFDLTAEVEATTTSAELHACLHKVDTLNTKIANLWVPRGSKDSYANLLNAMAVLHALMKQRESDLQAT